MSNPNSSRTTTEANPQGTFFAELLISSKEMNAAQMSSAIGLHYDRAHSRGDIRKHTSIKEDENLWVVRSRLPRTTPLEEHVREVLSRLTPVSETVKKLAGRPDFDVQFGCFAFTDEPLALGFDSDVIAAICALGGSLDVDLYFFPSEGGEERMLATAPTHWPKWWSQHMSMRNKTEDEFQSRLAISGETIVPTLVSSMLGLECDICRGERDVGGKANWVVYSKEDYSCSLEDHVTELLQRIRPTSEKIAQIAKQPNTLVEFGCLAYSDGRPPLHFDRPTVANICELGARLEIDLYVYPQSDGGS